jgi:non-ribosomal peptide synthetase component F
MTDTTSIRELVLSMKETRLEPVTGEGIPDGLFVGKLTVGGADGLRGLAGKSNQTARLFIAFARNAAGEAIFTGEDLAAIEDLPAEVVTAAVQAGMTLNGMMDDTPASAPEATVP